MTLLYTTPAAFRRALTERLRAAATPYGPWPLAELQRQFAYDRLLARLYHRDSGWIIKGATALLARELAVRRTVDIDVYRPTDRDQAELDLRRAAAHDLGDWFTFEAGRASPVSDGANGVRIPTTARIGTTEWVRFHIDVVAENIRMTGSPDDVPPLLPIALPGLDRPGYRVYPLADHIADKTCAIPTESMCRATAHSSSSTSSCPTRYWRSAHRQPLRRWTQRWPPNSQIAR